FFSSRRRHTRSKRDWSSDVCSSDLDMGHEFHTGSDTEAIVHAYDQYGTECPKYLRGMFAFAIWDERTKSLFLARDRVGKKPLLYAEVNGNLVFGSEFTALLANPDVSRDVNLEAIHHYLSF